MSSGVRGIGFNVEQVGHFDRSGLADARHIIAQQIGDHQVFSAVFGVGRKKVSARAICFWVAVARLGTFHWPRLYLPLGIGAKNNSGARDKISGIPSCSINAPYCTGCTAAKAAYRAREQLLVFAVRGKVRFA